MERNEGTRINKMWEECCPECKGSKYIIEGDFFYSNVYIKCKGCNGTGSVSWIEIIKGRNDNGRVFESNKKL